MMPLAAMAGVAGVVVMAGVLVLSRPGAGGSAALPIATAGPDGVIRDVRLQEFLRAHQAARSGVAAGVPGSALRSVDAVLPTAAGQ